MGEDISEGRNVWVIEAGLVRGVTGDPPDGTWWVAIPADGELWKLTDPLRQEIEELIPPGQLEQAQFEDPEVAAAMAAIARRGQRISGAEGVPFDGV